MKVREALKAICIKKPFTPWLPVCVGVGAAVGAGPDVPMGVGVGAGLALGILFSLWRMR